MPGEGFAQTTIVVSGYPPVAAFVWRTGTTGALPPAALASAARAFDLEQYQARIVRTFAASSPGAVARCGCCRCWAGRSKLADARLGFTGYCDACVARLATACTLAHGRLPRMTEFFCARCQQIRPRKDRAKPDADSRRRYRCQACRGAQVAKADRRRKGQRTASLPSAGRIAGVGPPLSWATRSDEA